MKVYDMLRKPQNSSMAVSEIEFTGKNDESSVWTYSLEPNGKGHYRTSKKFRWDLV